MRVFLSILLLIGAAVSLDRKAVKVDGDRFNIDDRVDEVLPLVNSLLKSLNCKNVTLPDLFLPEDPIFIGVTLEDLTTLVRDGTAEMWQDDDETVSAQVPLSLKDARVHVSDCTFMNEEEFWMSLEEMSFQVGFSVASPPDGSCTSVWDYFNVTTLGSIAVHSSDPKYDGKPLPPQVTDILLPHYNFYLNSKEFLKLAKDKVDLCNPSYNFIK